MMKTPTLTSNDQRDAIPAPPLPEAHLTARGPPGEHPAVRQSLLDRPNRFSPNELLHDWIRQPLPAYLAWRRDVLGEGEAESRRRGFRLFPVHNKYTTEDWQWLLAEAGFTIRYQEQLRASHQSFVATRRD